MPDNLSIFKKVERQLNKLTFKGAEIGSLLSKYHTLGYLNRTGVESNFKYLLSFIKVTCLGFLKPLAKPDREKFLFLNKLGNRPQCNALIDPILDEFKDIALLYTPGVTNGIDYNFTRRLNFRILLNIIRYLFNNLRTIIKHYETNNLKIPKFELCFVLYIQLIAYSNWLEYFKKSLIALFVTDFDRDYRTAPMVLAAQKNNIKTITLVHGILNPPFAYVPVIADQIWCWGDFQKKQLISYDVPEEKIQVVGNPIANNFRKGTRKILTGEKTRIGIGLNPIGSAENQQFLNVFRNYNMHQNFFWIVKLHPSLKRAKWMKEMESSNLKFYENGELDTRSFFNEIDLLVVSNSGIGYEAVVNNIPIWVYRIMDGQNGHDGVMIDLGNCPDISNTEILTKEMDALVKDKNRYLEALLLEEEEFVCDEYYEAIGEEATKNIIKCVKKIMNNAK